MRRALGLVVVGCLLLSGCSLLGGPKAEDAADRLATALTERDVSGLSFVGATGKQAQTRLRAVLEQMTRVPARVRAVDVSTDGDSASGVLVWTWRVAGEPWVTRAPVQLRQRGDAWRAVWSTRLVHTRLAAGDTLRATSLLATRGDILGDRGRRLVTDRAVVHYGLDKTRVDPAAAVASARALARLVGIDPAAYADRVRKAGAKAYVDAVTLRADGQNPPEARVLAIDGARVTPGKVPLAPTRTFAAALLGRVGEPTAEMVTKSRGRLTATDQVGIGGLQARYQDRLAGTPGGKVSLVGADGQGTVLHRVEPTPGRALRTTLDVNAQEIAERVLSRVGPASALVAVRPSTGAVVAAANGPGAGALNVATYGRYAPGSTFKVVSSLALLRRGVSPTTTVTCPTAVTVDGKRFTNYSDYPASAVGSVSFRTAIANSCNTAVIGQRDRLRPGDLQDAAAALGFGTDHDVGFPAYFGQVPRASSATEGAADLIGQGKVLASPMAMAAVLASVGAGRTVVPHLVEGRTASADPDRPLTKVEAAQLRTLLRAVVTDGSGRLLDSLPGAPTYAKTGTAEYGTARPPRTHAWMVALHGDLAVAVFVADGDTGSGVAGPLLRSFLQQVP